MPKSCPHFTPVLFVGWACRSGAQFPYGAFAWRHVNRNTKRVRRILGCEPDYVRPDGMGCWL